MVIAVFWMTANPIKGQACVEYNNTKTTDHPEIATHPSVRADFVIGTDADMGDHSHLRNGVLGGFDIELTNAVCAMIGKKCAIVMVPWQSVWAADYPRYDWSSNPKHYPGKGHHHRWFHCVAGARRLPARQQSVAFTHSYTDSSLDTAGFVVRSSAAASFPHDAEGKKVGVIQAFAATSYLEANLGSVFRPINVVRYGHQTRMWAALTAGDVEAAFVDGTTAIPWLSSTSGYEYVRAVAGWSGGVAYQCHPEYGDVLSALNQGLVAFKATPEYAALCARYPRVACDTSGATYANAKTATNPEIADHPSRRADIVIATEADFGDHNYIRSEVLGGFDVELTTALCAHIGKTCAMVTVPWQAVWTSNYSRFGWPRNTQNYPGEGHHNRWFHCAVGVNNIVVRQQSIAFTNPYTDKELATAGFVVPSSAAAAFPADARGAVVGVIGGWASTTYFEMHLGARFTPKTVRQFVLKEEMWTALSTGDIDAVYTDRTTAQSWLSADHGYQFVHSVAGWSNGVAYGCHPEYGDVVSMLNQGLVAFKGTQDYRRLCGRYPTIHCDWSGTTYTNTKTPASPEIADHPAQRAAVVIGTEADWGEKGGLRAGVLHGFGPEFTKAVCAMAGKVCAIVTMPWEAAWPSDYSNFGWPSNTKHYMGEGHQGRWFHCTMMTANTVFRQQSATFTHPYTDPSVDKAGFVVPRAVAPGFPPDARDKVVGLLKGWVDAGHFEAQRGVFVFNPKAVLYYPDRGALWTALTTGRVDAAYLLLTTSGPLLAPNTDYEVVHAAAGITHGLSYGCHPEYGDIVAALNAGVLKFKATPEYAALCLKYPSMPCDTDARTFYNVKSPLRPQVADHSLLRADIVIATDGGFADHAYVRHGVLGGFDIELTKAVCAEAGKTCEIVTAPFQSARPHAHAPLGWARNPKHYPGEGLNSRWYHCTAGALHIVARQQNAAFTDPYTAPSADRAGFVVPDSAAAAFPADAAGRAVGVLLARAPTFHFEAHMGSLFRPKRVVPFELETDMWRALVAEDVDAVYTLESAARGWLSSGHGYRLMHPVGGWAKGVAYQCHPEYGDVVAALNKGIRALKATSLYRELCAKYATVKCDCPEANCVVGDWSAWGVCSARCGGGTRRRARPVLEGADSVSCPALEESQRCNTDECGCAAYDNLKTPVSPHVADHPLEHADIVIGFEMDYVEHTYFRDGVHGGFSLELTKAVCAQVGKSCATVAVPWQSVWSFTYDGFGWPRNTKNYPGEGHHRRWFHCSAATRNIIVRQQSVAFTHPYTDKLTDTAGFIVAESAASSFPEDAEGRTVGLLAGWASGTYCKNRGDLFKPTKTVEYGLQRDLYAALVSGALDALYLDSETARDFLSSDNGYTLIHMAAGWSGGLSYGCHPEYGDVVSALNQGLEVFKTTEDYGRLCAKYPSILCDTSGATYANVKTFFSPEIADHPTQRADIVIGTEADFAPHNYIRNGVLGGFDVELTKAVCARAGRTCAIVTVPWQAAWAANYSRFGWPSNSKNYPGEGHQQRWFHCMMGTFNLIARQQSIAFTSPYTDKTQDKAGFVVAAAAASAFPSDAHGRVVGVMNGWSSSTFFLANVGSVFRPAGVQQFGVRAEMWAALAAGAVDAVYTDASTAAQAGDGYRYVHALGGWSGGISYGCHPEYGDIVAALNEGLAAFKATEEYRQLCARFPGIACDTSGTVYANVKTPANPEIADHPQRRADIVLGTEADWGIHENLVNGVLGGFAIEFTKAVCAAAGKACAIVTVPWEAAWASGYPRFGWAGNPLNYPGEGHQSRWFHCTLSTTNIVERQQSVAFTDPYTDANDLAGFVVGAAAAPRFPADAAGKRVGLQAGWAVALHFLRQAANFFFFPAEVRQYTTEADMWAALTSGKIDAVYVDVNSVAMGWIRSSGVSGYRVVHAAAGFSRGLSFGCHPERGDIVAALNRGLAAFKASPEFAELCAKYPSVQCDTSGTTFRNTKTSDHPEIADHPPQRADLVVGMVADFAGHSYVQNGELRGFDVELTKAACAHAGRACAIVTVPQQSVTAARYARFGWARNPKRYPGEGHYNKWFHCAAGTANIVPWQQSIAYTHPYTSGERDAVGFVVSASVAAAFPADAAGKTVGLLQAVASAVYFESKVGALFRPGAVAEYRRPLEVWTALTTGAVDAVFVDATTAKSWLAADNGYQVVHAATEWSRGVAFGCHPEYGHALAALNRGLTAFKATWAYNELCNKYPHINCDCTDTECRVGEWSAWGACSLGCGMGSRARSRLITSVGLNGTQSCPHLEQTRVCVAEDCRTGAYTGAYTFLFDGCPKGGLAFAAPAEKVMLSSYMDRAGCERACNADEACNMIEVNGCLKSPDCRGQCWLFSGTGQDVYSGGCDRSGNQKTYLKPSALPFHYLFDGCPSGALVSRRYGAASRSKTECERDCLVDPNCTAVELTGCAGGPDCPRQCSLFSGHGRNVHRGLCGAPRGQAVYLKPAVPAECTPGRNPCAPNAQCRIVAGAFRCACKPGTRGSGTVCETFTPTATPTGTATRTPSATATASSTAAPTASLTPTATHTALPTTTAVLSTCVEGAGASPTGPLQIPGGGLCVQPLSLGSGSVSLRRRSVYLLISEMAGGELLLHLEVGCQATGPGCPLCEGCVGRYTPQHVGRPQLLPVASVPEISVLLLYRAPAAARRPRGARAGADGVVAAVYAVSAASPLLLALVCGASAALVACALALCGWCGRRRVCRAVPEWRRNPRLARRSIQAALLVSAWGLGTGGAWVGAALLTSDPEALPRGLLCTGIAMAAAGLAGLLGVALWAAWDPVAYRCPVCRTRVSRFRGCGVYLPAPDGRAVAGKAHAPHVRCVQCGRAVVRDPWPEAPPHRPWHAGCWAAHCARVCGDAAAWGQWCEGQGPALTDTELLHMFAAAIARAADVGARDAQAGMTSPRASGPGAQPLDPGASRAHAHASGGARGRPRGPGAGGGHPSGPVHRGGCSPGAQPVRPGPVPRPQRRLHPPAALPLQRPPGVHRARARHVCLLLRAGAGRRRPARRWLVPVRAPRQRPAEVPAAAGRRRGPRNGWPSGRVRATVHGFGASAAGNGGAPRAPAARPQTRRKADPQRPGPEEGVRRSGREGAHPCLPPDGHPRLRAAATQRPRVAQGRLDPAAVARAAAGGARPARHRIARRGHRLRGRDDGAGPDSAAQGPVPAVPGLAALHRARAVAGLRPLRPDRDRRRAGAGGARADHRSRPGGRGCRPRRAHADERRGGGPHPLPPAAPVLRRRRVHVGRRRGAPLGRRLRPAGRAPPGGAAGPRPPGAAGRGGAGGRLAGGAAHQGPAAAGDHRPRRQGAARGGAADGAGPGRGRRGGRGAGRAPPHAEGHLHAARAAGGRDRHRKPADGRAGGPAGGGPPGAVLRAGVPREHGGAAVLHGAPAQPPRPPLRARRARGPGDGRAHEAARAAAPALPARPQGGAGHLRLHVPAGRRRSATGSDLRGHEHGHAVARREGRRLLAPPDLGHRHGAAGPPGPLRQTVPRR